MKKILLSLSFITVAFMGKAQNCSELFISEYLEGTQNTKAIEIYNPTNAAISLSNYRLVRYSNGSSTGADSTDFTSTLSIGSYSTFVIANGVGVTSQTTSTSPACDPALQALAQQIDQPYPNPTAMNGDDAMVLVRKSPYARIDIFGKIGEQPATAWSDIAPYDGTAGKWWTKDHSMIRKASVKMGVMTNPAQFNPKLEYDSLPRNTFTNIGLHTCDCAVVGINENVKSVRLSIFPNPSNGTEIAFVSNTEIKEINIINALGQVVFSHSYASENSITLKNLVIAKGVYYAIVKNKVGTRTEKIIIQ
jgi:hypothetical protein